MPIVDVHGHWGPWFFHLDAGDERRNLALMDRYGITLQLVSSSLAVTYDAVRGNEALARVLDRHPRLLGYVVVNPNRVEDGERDLRRYLDGGRFFGVKVHTSYAKTPIGSAALAETFDLVATAGVPLLLHTWERDVELLPEILAQRPGLRVVVGHAGGDAWREAARAAAACDRLYLEHCRTVPDAGRVQYARSLGVPVSRFLLGTDSTLVDPCVALGVFRDAGFVGPERDDVLWRNADALFGLGGRPELRALLTP